MNATNTKNTVQLTQAQILVVRLYRRYKQIEKTFVEKLGALKTRVVSIHPGEWTGYDGEKKVVSVSFQTRKSLDKDKLQSDHPEIDLSKYESESEPFVVVRLH